jgi:hypothetical protein
MKRKRRTKKKRKRKRAGIRGRGMQLFRRAASTMMTIDTLR